MRVPYYLALAVSGVCWFGVAGVLGSAIPIFGEMWAQHLVSAIITSLAVGYIFKKLVMTWLGWRWYVLPILTVLVASALYGLLVPSSWWAADMMQRGDFRVEGEAFYFIPPVMVFYSMTVYIVILYPLALLTQTVLRNVYRNPAR